MRYLIAGFALAVAVAVAADEPPTLTVDQAVSRALEANARLAVQAAELAAAQAGAKAAGKPPPLRLSLSPASVWGLLEAGISAVLDLSGRRKWASRAARHELAATVAGNEEFRLELVAGTRSTYWELRLAQERLALAGEQVALAQRTRDAAARLAETGVGKRIDLARAENDLRQAELGRWAASADIRQAQSRLALLLALPPETAITAADPVPPEVPALPPGPRLQSEALASRPAVRRVNELAQASLARVGVAGAEASPDLGVSLARETGVSFGRALLDLPLIDFGTIKYGKRAARARAQGALAEATVIEGEIRQEVQAAADALAAAAFAEQRLAKELIPQQADIVARLQRAYEAQSLTLIDLLEAQGRLQEMRVQWLDAARDRLDALVRLERALGTPLEGIPDADDRP